MSGSECCERLVMPGAYVDTATLTKYASELDAGFVEELLSEFFKSVDSSISELNIALTLADSDQVYRVAHTVKGNSKTVGANQLAQLAENIQNLAKEGQLFTATSKFELFCEVCRETVEELTEWQLAA